MNICKSSALVTKVLSIVMPKIGGLESVGKTSVKSDQFDRVVRSTDLVRSDSDHIVRSNICLQAKYTPGKEDILHYVIWRCFYSSWYVPIDLLASERLRIYHKWQVDKSDLLRILAEMEKTETLTQWRTKRWWTIS